MTIALGICNSGATAQETTPASSDGNQQQLDWRSALIAAVKNHRQQGNLAEALAAGDQLLDVERELFGPDHQNVESTLTFMVGLANESAEYARAQSYARQLIQVRSKLFGTEDYRVVDANWMLRDAQAYAEMSAESLKELQEATKQFDAAIKLNLEGRRREVLPGIQASYDLRRKVLGDEHPLTAYTLMILGHVHLGLGEFADAEPKFEQALAASKRLNGPQHPQNRICADSARTAVFSAERVFSSPSASGRVAGDSRTRTWRK
jgi:tetratricopeptide (TPR) repeat protein